MKISDEAVEAAVEAVKVFFDGKPPRGTRAAIRLALEAAAPYMLAEAWDAGFEGAQGVYHETNPYRSRA